MLLSEDMKKFVLEQRLGYHATVNPDGTPNLSHKGTTSIYDDEHLFFADIRSPQTVANLRANPSIEVNVVDVFSRRGYRFRGTATIHEQDDTYRRALELLRERDYGAYDGRVRSIVLIRVESAKHMTSPAYDLGQSEAELIDHYIEYYVGLHRRPEAYAPGVHGSSSTSTPSAVKAAVRSVRLAANSPRPTRAPESNSQKASSDGKPQSSTDSAK